MKRTYQELFDFVAENLIKQGRPSINSKGRCLYRSDDGCKCAIGWLIPDDKYKPDMEHKLFTKVIEDIFEDLVVLDIDFLLSLRRSHDYAAENENWLEIWRTRMLNLATRFGLDSSILVN